MKTRILSGLTAATLTILLFLYGPIWSLLAVELAAACIGYLEYDKLFFGPSPSRTRPIRLVTLISLTLLAMRISPTAAWMSSWLAISFLLVSHVVSGNRRNIPLEVRAVSLELMGFWYIVSMFGFLVPLADIPLMGRQYLLLLFFLVFAGDTGAYFVGKYFGRRKLASNLSPKKTVEGAIGGIVFSCIGALAWLALLGPSSLVPGYLTRLLIVAPIIGALAQFGDLFESLLKRSQHQKDSGSFLPGHGGMLDRVDGLALSAPAFYFYVVYVLETLP